MKRVLVTGATGFIGRNTLDLLLDRGYEVHAVTSSPLADKKTPVHWHYLDLHHSNETAELLHRIQATHLLHLAWDTTPGKYANSSNNLQWIKTSLTLLEEFTKQGGQRVVQAGSCAEYDWDYGVCVEDKTPCLPRTLYGHSKQMMQQVSSSFCQQHGISFAQGRVFYLFGENEHPKRFVPQVMNGLINNKNTPCSEGRQLRDFLYVKDVASAFVSLLDSEVEGVVNIASGNPVSLRNIVAKISQFTGNSECVKFGELNVPENEPEFLLANVDRLKNEVNWQPEYSMDQALKETVGWWQQQGERA